MKQDVHTRHCCSRPDHGCQYGGDRDGRLDCTVVIGRIPQEYPCEACSYDEENSKLLKECLEKERSKYLPTKGNWDRIALETLEYFEISLVESGVLYAPPRLQSSTLVYVFEMVKGRDLFCSRVCFEKVHPGEKPDTLESLSNDSSCYNCGLALGAFSAKK